MGQHTSVTSLLGKNTGDFSRKQVQRKLIKFVNHEFRVTCQCFPIFFPVWLNQDTEENDHSLSSIKAPIISVQNAYIMNHARTTEQGAKREQLGVKQVMIQTLQSVKRNLVNDK